jgi:hypothetical protein
MDWGKARWYLVLAAIAVGVTYYYKPEYFQKLKPIAETVMTEVKSLSANPPSDTNIQGVYSCPITEDMRLFQALGGSISDKVSISHLRHFGIANAGFVS